MKVLLIYRQEGFDEEDNAVSQAPYTSVGVLYTDVIKSLHQTPNDGISQCLDVILKK